MIAILGIIPVILIGIMFFFIDPAWSVLWILLLALAAIFALKGKKRT